MGSVSPSINVQKAVTVVIPCFNSGPTIIRTVESIRKQSYPDIEILIVNDGSTDPETLALFRQFRAEGISVIQHELNSGLPAARNTGFRLASGQYVLFLDSDDWYEEDAIELMVSRAGSTDEHFFIYTDLVLEGKRSGILERPYRNFTQLMINRIPCSIFISKSQTQVDQLYDESLTLGLEDWDLNLTLISRGFTPLRIAAPLFHYYVSPNGMFLSRTHQHFFSIWRQIRRKHNSLYSSKNILRALSKEVKNFGISSVLSGTIMFLLSLIPFDQLLNRFLSLYLRVKSL